MLQYASFPYTPLLGWSSSRYEIFDKCRRQYFYCYYSSYAKDQPAYKIKKLKSMTSVALEVGDIVHGVLEAFLKRLQKNDSAIDEKRFFHYGKSKADEQCAAKTFMEVYYKKIDRIDMQYVYDRIDACLRNFLGSSTYNWIFMKALYNKDNWMIEPEGYGETRIDGIKAYCKMDFLFPVDGCVYIMDWKTGKKDDYKHRNQLVGYAAAAAPLLSIPWKNIVPRIIYLYPRFDELELVLDDKMLNAFYIHVREEAEAMYAMCEDREKNIPLPMEKFPMMPSESVCSFCNFQEICFPKEKRYPGDSTVSSSTFENV